MRPGATHPAKHLCKFAEAGKLLLASERLVSPTFNHDSIIATQANFPGESSLNSSQVIDSSAEFLGLFSTAQYRFELVFSAALPTFVTEKKTCWFQTEYRPSPSTAILSCVDGIGGNCFLPSNIMIWCENSRSVLAGKLPNGPTKREYPVNVVASDKLHSAMARALSLATLNIRRSNPL
jgi:hypothetical protein